MRQSQPLEELIFWHVFDRPQSSRSDLSDRFGVSPATVSRSVSILLEHHLVIETAREGALPGRKAQLIQVNPKLAVLVGVEVEIDRVRAVVTDFAGTLLGRGAVPCDARQGPPPVLEASRTAVTKALADAELSWQKVDHVGIGHPGDLDHERGVCASWAIAPGWSGVPLRKHFEEVFRMHVYIDDISRAVALAERHTSPQDWSHPDAIYIQTGTGIGMGTFIDGRLYRGSTRGGGEIGHTVIDLAGPLCKCGNRGCVEAIASTGSIVRQVSESIEAGQSSSLSTLAAPITIEQVLEHAHRCDQLARTVLARAYDALGIGIANAIQILNPSLVVLCGRLARLAGDDLLEVVVRNVKRQCVATASRQVAVRVAKPKKDISTVGCALIAAEAQAQRVVRMRLSGTTGTTA